MDLRPILAEKSASALEVSSKSKLVLNAIRNHKNVKRVLLRRNKKFIDINGEP